MRFGSLPSWADRLAELVSKDLLPMQVFLMKIMSWKGHLTFLTGAGCATGEEQRTTIQSTSNE